MLGGGKSFLVAALQLFLADSGHSEETEERLLYKKAPSRDPVVHLFPHSQWRPVPHFLLYFQVREGFGFVQFYSQSSMLVRSLFIFLTPDMFGVFF